MPWTRLLASLALGCAAACSPDPGGHPGAETASVEAPPAAAADAELAGEGAAAGDVRLPEAAPADGPGVAPIPPSTQQAAEEEPEAPPSEPPMPPLSDLLRLPTARKQEPESGPLEAGAPESEAEAEARQREEGRIGVDFETRTDAHAVQPEKNRTRTDAGVSVGIDERTKVRGGVRVEQDAGKERESPVPTVGIEKRF
jgi:hypothetical protein